MTRPIRTEAYAVYMCGECQSEYSESVDYVNKIGKILCICGEIIKCDPIKSVKLSFGKSEDKQNTGNIDIEPYITGLVNLGFTRAEAKRKINDSIETHGYDNLDDIIMGVLV